MLDQLVRVEVTQWEQVEIPPEIEAKDRATLEREIIQCLASVDWAAVLRKLDTTNPEEARRLRESLMRMMLPSGPDKNGNGGGHA